MDAVVVVAIVVGSMFAFMVIRSFYLVFSGNEAVERATVERFSKRWNVEITPENGNAIISYIARKRHWRRLGIWISGGIIVTIVLARHEIGYISWWPLVLGWLIGGMVAELQANQPIGDTIRVAGLKRRTFTDYIPRWHWVVTAVVLAMTATYTVMSMVHRDRGLNAWIELVLFVGVAVAWTIAARTIIGRARPVMCKDLENADLAMRSRSLQVCSAATVFLCGMGMAVAQAPDDANPISTPLILLAFFMTTRRYPIKTTVEKESSPV